MWAALFAASSNLSWGDIGAICGILAGGYAIIKWRKVGAFFMGASKGAERSAVNSAAVDVVELLRTEVEELRIQGREKDNKIADLTAKVADLTTRLAILRDEITGEGPIKELASELRTFTQTMTEGMTTLLARVGDR